VELILSGFNPSNASMLVVIGLLLLLAGVVLYYIEYAINAAINTVLETVTLGAWDNDRPVFPDYQLPSVLIGIGLICVAIPFLLYFASIVQKILREKIFNIKDSIVLTASSFFIIRFVDFTTTSLDGIDKTVPYAIMGIGFVGIILPVAMFVGFILRNKIRKKKSLDMQDIQKIVISLTTKDFLWIIGSGVTLIICDYLLGKVYFDDEAVIPRIVADFGYVYVITPLSIYLYRIIKNKVRNKKSFGVKDVAILFTVGFASIGFVGLTVNMVPNEPLSIDIQPHIGDKVLHFTLYFLGVACIIMALIKVIRGAISLSKNKEVAKIKGYPALMIEYTHVDDLITEIKKIWK
jgi:hypothetical protein